MHLTRKASNVRQSVLVVVFLVNVCASTLLLAWCSSSRRSTIPLRKPSCDSERPVCRVAVISTWPPAKCGIAEFTRDLVTALKLVPEFASSCTLEVLPIVGIHDKQENYMSMPEYVGESIVDDKKVPFDSFYHVNMEYIRRRRFTHVVIQQEFGLTSIQWQMNDMARWLYPFLTVVTVVHTPRAYPSIEEVGLVRQLADNSHLLVVMSWHAVHSLVHAFGVDEAKIRFIPHGVSLPQALPASSSTPSIGIAELDDRSNLIALSFGLIHAHKGLHRLVRTMPSLIQQYGNFYFVIAGMEHPSSSSPVMPTLLQKAKEAGVDTHIIWINRYLSQTEAHWVHERADIIVSLYDEITPTSGTLLMAMSFGRAVIATHYRFAVEVLTGRGELVPFEDDAVTLQRFSQLLGSSARREELGRTAFEFVRQWTWGAVAKEYLETILHADDPSHRFNPLTPNPFEGVQQMAPQTSLRWSHQGLQLFELYVPSPVLPSDFQVMYVDHVMQINVKLYAQRAIEAIAVETPSFLALVNRRGFDVEFKPGVELAAYEAITYTSTRLHVRSLNIHFVIELIGNQIEFFVESVNMFSAPKGIFGEAIRQHYDLSLRSAAMTNFLHTDSTSPADLIFSHDFASQKWSFFGINVNVYRNRAHDIPQGVFRLEPLATKNVTFTIEGPIFNLESFAVVNRQLFLQLHWTHVRVLLKPTDTLTNVDVYANVETSLVAAAYVTQGRAETNFLFRNAWPPNFAAPKDDKGQPDPSVTYIHQQPWEFTSIPQSWVAPLRDVVHEIWVPSIFCRDIYASNGLSMSKIHVVPHGINYKKYALETGRTPLGTNKSFVFFFIGGLLPRKGIDVLLKAYSRAFTVDDDVALLIHTIYGDKFQRSTIANLMHLQDLAPEIVLHETPLSWTEYVKTLNSVHGFVSPFRSEGFGLTILEAMSKGLAPIIPYYGPPKEFAPNNTAFYFATEQQDCSHMPPCGRNTMFGEPTVFQPQWGEPSVSDLSRAMREAYTDRVEGRRRGLLARQEASRHTWDSVGRLMLDRINALGNRRLRPQR